MPICFVRTKFHFSAPCQNAHMHCVGNAASLTSMMLRGVAEAVTGRLALASIPKRLPPQPLCNIESDNDQARAVSKALTHCYSSGNRMC